MKIGFAGKKEKKIMNLKQKLYQKSFPWIEKIKIILCTM